MASLIPEVTTEVLQAFADAWNRHDIDALMSFMADDCVFESSAGPEICGTSGGCNSNTGARGRVMQVRDLCPLLVLL